MTKKLTLKERIKPYILLAKDIVEDLIPRPSLKSLAHLGGAGVVLGSAVPALADNVIVENTIETKEDDKSKYDFQKTRLKAGLGTATFTYDRNHNEDPDEAKLWVDALSEKEKGINLGILVEGETDNNAESYADLGACVSKTFGRDNYEIYVGPTIQPGVKPLMFYQAAIRDTSGGKNLLFALIDDKEVPFKSENLDLRAYFTGQKGSVFAGSGINQKGKDTEKLYGGAGFNNGKSGAIGVYRYKPLEQKGKFKIMGAIGEPGGALSIGTLNLWNDIEGPGIRGVGKPYFSSYLTKGDITSKVEGEFDPKSKDYEVMIGKNLGVVRVGAGVNYHREDGKNTYGGLFHVAKDVNLGKGGKFGKLYGEGRFNTRTGNKKIFVKYQRGF